MLWHNFSTTECSFFYILGSHLLLSLQIFALELIPLCSVPPPKSFYPIARQLTLYVPLPKAAATSKLFLPLPPPLEHPRTNSPKPKKKRDGGNAIQASLSLSLSSLSLSLGDERRRRRLSFSLFPKGVIPSTPLPSPQSRDKPPQRRRKRTLSPYSHFTFPSLFPLAEFPPAVQKKHKQRSSHNSEEEENNSLFWGILPFPPSLRTIDPSSGIRRRRRRRRRRRPHT